jgi:hypothetical protein
MQKYNSQNLHTIDGKYIPLTSQTICLNVKDQIANFTVEQIYFNNENHHLETVFTFPVPAEASLYKFEATIFDKTTFEKKDIKCIIKEKDIAKIEYNEAINQCDTAYYMERIDGDIFSIRIGNLYPNTQIKVCICYVTELKNELDHRKVRITIPLTIMPKYKSKNEPLNESINIFNPLKTNDKPFDVAINGSIYMGDGIVSIDSLTHKIKLSEMKNNSINFDIYDLEDIDGDIVLTVERHDSKSHAITQEFTEASLQHPLYKWCTSVSLVPDFDKYPPLNINDMHYVFLLDKSGSMKGKDIEICKQAGQHFLALLPTEATFDIYTFSSSFEKFECEETNTISKKIKASEWIDRIFADGCTELYAVLSEIYFSSKKINKKTTIIIISDGGISDTERVLKLVKSNPDINVFSIGIGDTVSQELIQGLATQGNGHSEFIGRGDRNIIQKVRAQLKRSQDSLRKNQNQYKIDIGVNHMMIPRTLPTLYDKTNNTIYIFSEIAPGRILYTETINDGTYTQTIIPTIVETNNFENQAVLHRIAATKLINELQYDSEENDSNKNEIINISRELNVLSKYTAMIGIEHKRNKQNGELITYEIPLQIPKKYRNNSNIIAINWGDVSDPTKRNMHDKYDIINHAFNRGDNRKEWLTDYHFDANKISITPGLDCSYNNKAYKSGYHAPIRTVNELRTVNCPKIEICNYDVKQTSRDNTHKKLAGSNSAKRVGRKLYEKREWNTNMIPPKRTENTEIINTKDNNGNSSSRARSSGIDIDINTINIKCTIERSFFGNYIILSNGYLLNGIVNGSLNDLLVLLGHIFLDNQYLQENDIIKLTREPEESINAVYKIINIGSINEPWTLEKIKCNL